MKYSTNTNKILKGIKKFLIEEYGEVKQEWSLTLTMLADNLELLNKCQESIKEHGIYDPQTQHKNPLLSTVKDINSTILKITQKLGITPWDVSKIKTVEEDDSEDFIENLTN